MKKSKKGIDYSTVTRWNVHNVVADPKECRRAEDYFWNCHQKWREKEMEVKIWKDMRKTLNVSLRGINNKIKEIENTTIAKETIFMWHTMKVEKEGINWAKEYIRKRLSEAEKAKKENYQAYILSIEIKERVAGRWLPKEENENTG